MSRLSKRSLVRRMILLTPILFLLSHAPPSAAGATHSVRPGGPEQLSIDTHAPGRAFPHFWETMFGSGRAVLVLRANYQDDLTRMKSETGIGYVRFHGLLDDDVGLAGGHEAAFYDKPSAKGSPYNFSYVDQICDALLARGVRPFVELDFMPKALAANPDMLHSFWYHPNISPPGNYKAWDRLIRALARHLVARYGIDEVSQWYLEVWNEPNLDFWGGAPRQKSYFKLYDQTARALKSVSARLRVGGPATAQAAWVSA
ncbi:MAG: glycosyl hydrolase family 39, partial [Steroidobacterales bacterium]